MPEWDEFVAPCPNCEGDGCEICDGRGRLVVPSKVEVYVTSLRQSLHKMRETRRTMMDTYRRWIVHQDTRASQIMRMMMEAAVYRGLEDTPEGRREFDLLMTKDILDMEDGLEKTRAQIEKGELIVLSAKEVWRGAKKEGKRRRARPAPPPIQPKPPPKETKAAGRLCRFPKCPKKSYVVDDKGRGWCKRHAYERGLLDRPKEKKDEEDDT